MRKISWLLLLTAVCACTSLRADLTIVQHMDFCGHERDTTMMIKAGRTRFGFTPAISVITDLKTGELVRLNHAQKTWVKIPGHMTQAAIDAIKRQLPGMSRNSGLALTPAGKKDTVSGYPADEYTGAIPGMNASAWLTKAAPDYANLLKDMSVFYAQGPQSAMLRGIFGLDLATLPGFPLRAVYEWQPGQPITGTVVSISALPIADSEFDIPAGYTETSMPAVGAGGGFY